VIRLPSLIRGAILCGAVAWLGVASPAGGKLPSLYVANASIARFFDAVLRSDGELRSARIVAPLGMLQMLAVLQAGSGGSTRAAITSLLGADVAGSNARALSRYSTVPHDVQQGNALWLQSTLRPSAGFKQFASTIGMPIATFTSDPGALRAAILAWLDRIGVPDAPFAAPADATAVGLNVLQIHATWRVPFQPIRSFVGTFHAPDGDRSVTFMRGKGVSYCYFRTGSLDAVNLPYTDGLSLWLGLNPRSGAGFSALLSAIAGGCSAASRTAASIVIPRFNVHTHVEYEKLLAASALAPVFANGADLRAMLGKNHSAKLALSQDIALAIDEQGTRVLAVTELSDTEKVDMTFLKLDRPFSFAIQDDATKALLLTGVVLDPSAK
jgi:serpin B